MAYSHKDIPSKTLKLLESVLKNDGKIQTLLAVNGCSDDENWARINELKELGFIFEGQGYDDNGNPCGGALFITNEGKAFLSDVKENRSARRREIVSNVLISALTAGLVAWGPSILSWLRELISQS